MADYFLKIGENPTSRRLVQTLGLPINLPPVLSRAEGPWEDRPFDGQEFAVGAAAGGSLGAALAETLAFAGAEIRLIGDQHPLDAWRGPAEAYGRPVQVGEAEDSENWRAQALVFDATGIDTPEELAALYAFFHPLVRSLRKNGRAVVLGRPASEGQNASQAAARRALEGFTRSLAKELGRKGSSAHVIYVDEGAEDRIQGPLRFLLSRRSAFVSGQALRVSKQVQTLAGNGASESTPGFTRLLEGKVALVTGAARGIGAATARLLAAEGARVVCLDRPADDAVTSRLAREIGGGVLLCDLSEPESATKIAHELQGRYGGVDIVVHNAGITRDRTLGRMSKDAWDLAVDVNLSAVLRVNEELLKGALRDNGRIICLSSVAGIAGNVGQTNYSASKAGVVGYVQRLAQDLAPRGIAVNAIAPGFIETRLTAAIPLVIREAGRRLSNLSQGGLPEDVGQAITFLASPKTDGLSGQILRVCGGALIGA